MPYGAGTLTLLAVLVAGVLAAVRLRWPFTASALAAAVILLAVTSALSARAPAASVALKPPPPSASPLPLPTAVLLPSPSATASATRCGAPPNPWNYNFCRGALITTPSYYFCYYFICASNFFKDDGYIVECSDGTYSLGGGTPTACSGHGPVKQDVYLPA